MAAPADQGIYNAEPRTPQFDHSHQLSPVARESPQASHPSLSTTEDQITVHKRKGCRSLDRRSSMPRRRSRWRLTASRRDGAIATVDDTTDATSKPARTSDQR
jgi:hypothetical protein